MNAKFPEHRDIGARANDLAIDQRTVAVEKPFLEIKGLNLMDIILVGFLHHFAYSNNHILMTI